jgi:hypothetical protein
LQAVVLLDRLHDLSSSLVIPAVVNGLTVLVDPYGNDVDVIMLGIRMPGYEVGRMLKAHCCHVPFSNSGPLLITQPFIIG